MVSVATGAGTGGIGENGEVTEAEQIPLTLKIPHLLSQTYHVCGASYSLLGYGDIAIPALLVSFCLSFDYKNIIEGEGGVTAFSQTSFLGKFRYFPYYISSCIGYSVGLFSTELALILTNNPQPALLYLVPGTLLFIVVTGWWKAQLMHLWRGHLGNQDVSSSEITHDTELRAVVRSDDFDDDDDASGRAIIASEDLDQQLKLQCLSHDEAEDVKLLA